MVDADSLSLTERLVLLGLVEAEREGETPIESLELKSRTRGVLDLCDPDVVGDLSEREVMRALNALGAKPYLEEHRPETSVAGKGRPEYSLDCPPTDVLEELDRDDQLADAVAHLQ